MDGWNTTFLLGRPIFRGELLISGRVDVFPFQLGGMAFQVPVQLLGGVFPKPRPACLINDKIILPQRKWWMSKDLGVLVAKMGLRHDRKKTVNGVS